MRFLFLSALLAAGAAASAQWRVQLQSGIAQPLKSQAKDSLFFAKRGTQIQAKATYYLGHLGLAVAVGLNKHGAYSEAASKRPPTLPDTVKATGYVGNGWTGTFITAGPEFCFPLKKIKFQLGVRAGAALQQADAVRINTIINSITTPVYANELRSKLAFAWQADAGAIFFSSQHFGYGIVANLSGTSIKADNRDIRFGINNSRSLKSSYVAVAVTGSLVFKF